MQEFSSGSQRRGTNLSFEVAQNRVSVFVQLTLRTNTPQMYLGRRVTLG